MLVQRVLLGVVALIFAGCGSRPRVAPAVDLQSGTRVATPNHQGEHGEILVWVRNDAGQTRTFRLAADGALRVLEERDGIVLATTHGELTWQSDEKEIDLDGCEQLDGTPKAPTKGAVTVANLVDAKGHVVQKVVDTHNTEGGDVNELQHHVELLGTMGPFLFIHEQTYVYACGAHGGTMASAFAWDAEQGKTIDLMRALPSNEKLAREAKRKLDEVDDASDGADEDTEKPEPTQLVPVYGERGALRLDVQFTRSACYVCSDGLWSSYTRSALVPSEWIPEALKTWVIPPVVVKEFLEAHRTWRLGGWSRR